ncbi:BA71V-CP312R [Elysia marginata]|uniref:BA71V-CP312R n=1 Tax=Elysia marginata TaxID=1093978 RepID=A0AAV4GUS3_9GAST|nr:BA71V-CP312R [Elysia marginata]
MASPSIQQKIIFNCDELIAACEAAETAGKSLSAVFSIDTYARPGPNNSKYMGLYATVPGKTGKLTIRVIKEKHVGQIPPLDEAEVARLNTERNGGYAYKSVVKKRDRNPTLNVQMYKNRVEAGVPLGDVAKSEYFRVCQYVNTFFHEAMEKRIKEGTIVVRDSSKPQLSSAFGAVTVSCLRIIPVFQSCLSERNPTNPCAELVNPICRTSMRFDSETGAPKRMKFYDYTKKYYDKASGKRQFEALTLGGHPVSAHNVHMIRPQSIFSGIVNMRSVCASPMGLSIPCEMDIVIVELSFDGKVNIDDVFEYDSSSDDDDESSSENGAAAFASFVKTEHARNSTNIPIWKSKTTEEVAGVEDYELAQEPSKESPPRDGASAEENAGVRKEHKPAREVYSSGTPARNGGATR